MKKSGGTVLKNIITYNRKGTETKRNYKVILQTYSTIEGSYGEITGM